METIECITSRRSIRKFHEQKVSHETIKKLIDCVRWSPSYANTKAVRYVAIDDPAAIAHVADNIIADENKHIVQNAPLLFVLSIIKGRCGRRRDGSFETNKGETWDMFDAGIASQTLCLAAHDMGLGTVMMATFDEKAIAEFVALPATEEPIIIIAAGYPSLVPPAPRRKEVHEILQFNRHV